MVKAIFALLLMFSFLSADELQDKIENIIGKDGYQTHRNLINTLFKSKSNFYNSDKLDIQKVLSTLKDNGLLHVKKSVTSLDIAFQTKSSPIFTIKAINDSLKALGYNYFITKSANRDSEKFEWVINIKSGFAPDPYYIVEEFFKRGYRTSDIKKQDDTFWSFSIDLISPRIPEAKSLISGAIIEQFKPLDDYWFDINGAGTITLSSVNGYPWYPSVVFYDKNLAILSIIEERVSIKHIELPIPAGAAFMKATDFYTITNLKNGLKATMQ